MADLSWVLGLPGFVTSRYSYSMRFLTASLGGSYQPTNLFQDALWDSSEALASLLASSVALSAGAWLSRSLDSSGTSSDSVSLWGVPAASRSASPAAGV